MIPPELSGIAAQMIQGVEDIDSERLHIFAERTTLHAALGSIRRQRKVLSWSIALHALGFLAWFGAVIYVVQKVTLGT